MDVWFCAPQEPCREAQNATPSFTLQIHHGGLLRHVYRATPSALGLSLTLLIMDGPFPPDGIPFDRAKKGRATLSLYLGRSVELHNMCSVH
jgi:hypothetical protein